MMPLSLLLRYQVGREEDDGLDVRQAQVKVLAEDSVYMPSM